MRATAQEVPVVSQRPPLRAAPRVRAAYSAHQGFQGAAGRSRHRWGAHGHAPGLPQTVHSVGTFFIAASVLAVFRVFYRALRGAMAPSASLGGGGQDNGAVEFSVSSARRAPRVGAPCRGSYAGGRPALRSA